MRIAFRCPPELEDFLPRPKPARQALPAWLRAMPVEAEAPDLGFAVRTVKQCPPFVDAMSAGFVMPLACDLRVEGGEFAWDWDPPAAGATGAYTRAPVSCHFAEQASGSPLHDPEALIVKFNSFWTIRLPEGWSLFCTHPVNRADLPFRTLTGLVDCDAFADSFVHFPAVWSDPDFSGVLPAGTPVAQCIPVPRQALELDIGLLDGEGAEAFARVQAELAEEPGVYRKRYRAKGSVLAEEPDS
jgi:hypothetical protein